ncbi:MAG: tetratricopeptide repeat protein, partial [Chitinophagaceae bacterium]
VGGGRIFFQNDFEIDDDTDPENNTSGDNLKNISDYLKSFRNFYHQNKEGSIKLEVSDVSDIRVGQNNLYLVVYFTETMNGKTTGGKPYGKRLKRAEMQVITENGQFRTLISRIDFADKKESLANVKTVTITDAKDDNLDADLQTFSEDYYKQKLSTGAKLLSESNYVDAYYDLKEAKRNGSTQGEADTRLNELFSKLRTQNIDPIDYLYDGLFTRAQALIDNYRYKDAKNYYLYAKEVKPINGKAIGTAISVINDKQAKDQVLWSLYKNGAYADAIKGFQKAIDKGQSDNPNMYIGLGRSYQALGKDDEANAAFASAIKADPTYSESYKWLGYFLKSKKDFKGASDAFINCQTRAEDPNEATLASEVAFTRGMLAFQRHENPSAINFLNTAITLNAKNKEAQLGLASVYLDQRDTKSANKAIKAALDLDNSYAEAYYQQGKIKEIENDKPGAEESYKAAIRFDPNNYVYYYDLGKIQMEPELAKYQDAIQNFSYCINAPQKMLFTKIALWKRGKCYYNLGNRDDDALQDFKKADAQMPTRPPTFYVEYANLLIRQKQFNQAMDNLSHAATDPAANVSMGVISYLQNPGDDDKYLNYFERAFRDGVAGDALKNNPTITELYSNSKKFRSLVKKYKYNSYF